MGVLLSTTNTSAPPWHSCSSWSLPTPACLNMLLKDMGAVDSWVFAVNEWLFELLFLVDRVIIAPYVTYRWLMLPGEFPAIMLGAMAFVHLFTLLFTPLILRNMWKRMKGERRSDKKKTG